MSFVSLPWMMLSRHMLNARVAPWWRFRDQRKMSCMQVHAACEV